MIKKLKYKYGNHLNLNNSRYKKEMKRRKCWKIPQNKKEKKMKYIDNQKYWQNEEKKTQESKIRDAFYELRYLSTIEIR